MPSKERVQDLARPLEAYCGGVAGEPDSDPHEGLAQGRAQPSVVVPAEDPAGFWVCCDGVVDENDNSCWDWVEVIASLGGDQLPLGRCFVPWARGRCRFGRSCCAASIELFEQFSKTAWSSESSYLGQIERLEKKVAETKEEKATWA